MNSRKGKTQEEIFGKEKAGEMRRLNSEKHMGHIAWNKGKSWSEETKKKISETKKKNPTKYWLGKKRPNLHKIKGFDRTGKKPWNYGIKCEQISKEKHWNWQGGKDRYGYDSYFKHVLSKILRANSSCSICGGNNDLVVHHIDLNKKNNSLANLQVLCRSHHTMLHHQILHRGKYENK